MSIPIVITSIFEPSEAVRLFSQMDGHNLIVVGDRKTPANWGCDGAQFLDVTEQNKYKLSQFLPFDHYCRKMLGYLEAFSSQPEFVVDTDDDNIPKLDWSFPSCVGDFDTTTPEAGFVNVYKCYTDHKVWPRGLPLDRISSEVTLLDQSKQSRVGVWQGLADEDPDVDAIYRLTDDTPIYFRDRSPVVLDKGTITPFNSQNTLFIKECFPLMYLPSHVSFRFTDILRGLVAQPIMWSMGLHLGFHNATVVQKRNPHDYMKDFESEVPMFIHGPQIVDIIRPVISSSYTVSDNLLLAYKALAEKRVVPDAELTTLSAWLEDISEVL